MEFSDGQGSLKETRLPPRASQGAAQIQSEVGADLAPVLGEILAQLREIREQLSAKTKDYFTVEEVARATGRAAYTVRRWVAEGRLAAIRLQNTGPRGRLLVPRDEFRRLIAAGLGGEVPNTIVA